MGRGFQIVDDKHRMHPSTHIHLPKRGTAYSAGYDICTPTTITIEPRGLSELIFTDIKAYMEPDEVLELYVRSSIGFKVGCILANCTSIIDSDYYGNPNNDGNICFRLKNLTDMPVTIEAGERIMQGVFKKYLIVDHDEPVKMQRTGGVGSTGKK